MSRVDINRTLLEDPDTSDAVTAHLIPAHSNIPSESVRLTAPIAFCCHLHRASCRHSHSIEIMRSINPCSTSPESFEAVVGRLCGDHIKIIAPVTLPAHALETIHLPASLRTVAPCQTVSSRQGSPLGVSPAAKHCPMHLSWPGSCSMEAWRVVACRLQLVYADRQPTPFSANGVHLFLGRLFTAHASQPGRAFVRGKVEPGRARSHVPGSCR